MKRYEQLYENRRQPNQEEGFTLIEVSIATLITMVGLMSLASLFTYAMYQNKHVKQHTAATALAQQKLEELTAIEKDDARLDIGGSLGEADKQAGYWDELNVNDKTGVVSPTPDGTLGNYKRYWQIQADPELDYTVIITVRVIAVQGSRGRAPEQTTLVSIRAFNK